MSPQQIRLVRTTFANLAPAYRQVATEMKAGTAAWKLSPLARHVDESPSVIPIADSVALHRRARQHRSRVVGDLIARAWTALASWTGRVLDVFATPATKRNPRADVI